jgi:hypothetical protein
MTLKKNLFKNFLAFSDLHNIDEGLSILTIIICAKEGQMKIERIYIRGSSVDRLDPDSKKKHRDFREEKNRDGLSEHFEEDEKIEIIDTAAATNQLDKKKIDLIV